MALQEELEIQGNWLFKYRSYLPIIIFLFGTGFFIDSLTNITNLKANPSEAIKFNHDFFYYLLICMLVSFVGLTIRCFTVGYTPSNTSGRNTTEQVADSINKTGFYSLVRHPLYFGNYFMWLGIGLITKNCWFLVVFSLVYWLYYERIMFAEEQFLRKKFNMSYLEWASKTNAFIPNFKKYHKPELPFSWKKVIKKEKDGFCLLAFIFALFHLLSQWLTINNITDFTFLIFFGIVFIFYIIARYLKHKTSILNEADR